MHHYVYSITYTDEPNIYYGVRSSKKLPQKDTKYWGSPVTFKAWMDAHEATRVKTILALYPTREEAGLAEDELIEQQWKINKPLSLNATIRGAKFNRLGRPQTQTQKKASILNGLAKGKPYFLVSPKGEIFEGVSLCKFCEDKDLDMGACWQVMKGRLFQYKGWTASIKAHRLYLQAYENRGVSPSKSGKYSYWRVVWIVKSVENQCYFKTKSEAIDFRDKLSSQGAEWRISCRNWRKRINNFSENENAA